MTAHIINPETTLLWGELRVGVCGTLCPVGQALETSAQSGAPESFTHSLQKLLSFCL